MKRLTLWAAAIPMVAAAWAGTAAACGEQTKEGECCDSISAKEADSVRLTRLEIDSINAVRADSLTRYETLTDADFQLVADELGIEVASMKAVVEIEAGPKMHGFWAPGVPIVNFDASMYRKYGPKAVSKAGDKNAKVPEGLTGKAKQAWTRLTDARKKNAEGADMGTFWGMFQIGGFHYKRCECATIQEFVDKMSYSELEQLELFAKFIKNSGMVEYLKKKDWAQFAKRYNGPSYAKRGYHTRMAKAYKKYSAQ